jgi:hypothetical protein
MRKAQCELVRALANEREAAGNVEGAKLAVFVAEALSSLEGRPSLKALKQSVNAPPAAAP